LAKISADKQSTAVVEPKIEFHESLTFLKPSTSNKNETNRGLAKMLDPSVNRKDLQQDLFRGINF